MTSRDITFYRLQAQQISKQHVTNADELVRYMGAVQAQDFGMVKWALGVRLPGSDEPEIQQALDSGKILRTHVLRPTWHLVSSRDIRWMLELTAPQLHSSVQARHRELELTPKILDKALKLICRELEQGHKTREELMTVLEQHKIATNEYRSGHIMFHAELESLVCSGTIKGNKQTYALLSERVPPQKSIGRDLALQQLASLYFNSHGPATLADFAWWAGLNQRDARSGLEAIRGSLQEIVVDQQSYWCSEKAIPESKPKRSLFLLPAFDEFLISYKDRSASLEVARSAQTISKNGIFFPIVVIDGQVAGLWKRTVKKDKVHISTEGLRPVSKAEMKLLGEAADAYAVFSGKKAVMEIGDSR